MAVTSVSNQAPPPPPPPPPQSVIDPPIKKIRLGELKQEIQTLRIETRVCTSKLFAKKKNNRLNGPM
jgi:hypothetical protein